MSVNQGTTRRRTTARKLEAIKVGMTGVDMNANAVYLPEDKLHSAVNMRFEEGRIFTRDGFLYHSLGSEGKYRGGTSYSPSKGISSKPFSDPMASLVYGVDSKFIYNILDCGRFTEAREICGKNVDCRDEVYMFQAENYLIAQSKTGSTWWWDGFGCFHVSLGLSAHEDLVKELVCEIEMKQKELILDKVGCAFNKMDYCKLEEIPKEDWLHSSHDSLCTNKHRHFLINSAGLGAYAHGRIHQESAYNIMVGDIIHKRGHKLTDDILLMEEQQLESYGVPLSTNSRLGQLRALQSLPAMDSANGEGDLIGYYDNGVVAYNTFQFPRETRSDAEGKTISEGWGTKRMVNHLLNTISAVGRYAVAVLPRDHAFRSKFGVHFLRLSLGVDSLRDEPIKNFSQGVKPILKSDCAKELRGCSVGHWVEGSRILVTTGLHSSYPHSASPMGKAFVSYNQASYHTNGVQASATWEGLWIMDNGMQGIHQFLNLNSPIDEDMFGFMCSDRGAKLYFAEPKEGTKSDYRDGKDIPIEWQVTTGKEDMGSLGIIKSLGEGRLEIIYGEELTNLKVSIRTDYEDSWKVWRGFSKEKGLEKLLKKGDEVIQNLSLGKAPIDYIKAGWYQLRVEGLGSVEIRGLEAVYNKDTGKNGKSSSKINSTIDDNYFEFNDEPISKRWQS